MHIPDHMFNNNNVPVATSLISSIGVAITTYFAIKSEEKPNPLKFATISALIFALQMINFPISNGTSGHFLGITFAILLLGAPFGILSMAIILTIQSLIFGDGGISALGANIFNMALIGALPGIILNYILRKINNINIILKNVYIFIFSSLSVIFASFFCSLELALSNTISFSKVVPAMIGVHIIIGIFEGIITIILYSFLFIKNIKESKRLNFILPFVGAIIISLILSPFASPLPDGLEWVAEKYQFLHSKAPYFVSPFVDYTTPFINNELLSTSIAGLFGVIITFLSVFIISRIFYLNKKIS